MKGSPIQSKLTIQTNLKLCIKLVEIH